MFDVKKFWETHVKNLFFIKLHETNDLCFYNNFSLDEISEHITLDEYNYLFISLVKQKIKEYMNLDENNLNLTETEKKAIINNSNYKNKIMFSKYEAETYFSDKGSIDKNSLSIEYKPEDISNLNIMYNSISDIDKKSDMEAKKYIEENKDDIYVEILQLKEIKKELELLKNSNNIFDTLKFIVEGKKICE